MVCIDFLPIHELSPHSVASFVMEDLFSLMQFNLSLFAFVAYTFGVLAKVSLPRLISWSLFPMFSLSNFTGSSLIFKSIFYPVWVDVCVQCEIVQFHYSACGYQVFPMSHIKDTLFPSLCVLATSVENQFINTWVYFWAFNSVLLVYVFVFMPVPHFFDLW